MESVFGKNYSFTDNTYSDLGMTPRNYSSLEVAGIEAGMSRLYAGIHYRKDCEGGLELGHNVAAHIVENFAKLDGAD